MGEINYESLVAGLVKPLITRPEDVKVSLESASEDLVKINVIVAKSDLGRVIGKKGRVAGAIRTIAHAAAIRNQQNIEITFDSDEE